MIFDFFKDLFTSESANTKTKTCWMIDTAVERIVLSFEALSNAKPSNQEKFISIDEYIEENLLLSVKAVFDYGSEEQKKRLIVALMKIGRFCTF